MVIFHSYVNLPEGIPFRLNVNNIAWPPVSPVNIHAAAVWGTSQAQSLRVT